VYVLKYIYYMSWSSDFRQSTASTYVFAFLWLSA